MATAKSSSRTQAAEETPARGRRSRSGRSGAAKKILAGVMPVSDRKSGLKKTSLERLPLGAKKPNVIKGVNDPHITMAQHLISFETVMKMEPFTGQHGIHIIRYGVPSVLLKSASAYLGVPEARINKIAHVAPSTASRLQKRGERIDSAATERVLRMGEVTKKAIEVFEDKAKGIAWMSTLNLALANVAPLDLMDTEPGAMSVRRVLNTIERGGVA